MKNQYEVLGVARTATDTEIKEAFRRLAKLYHPDVSQELEAQARFTEIRPTRRLQILRSGRCWTPRFAPRICARL